MQNKYKHENIVEALAYLDKKCKGSDPTFYIDSATKDLIIDTFNVSNEQVRILIPPKERATFTKIQVTRNLGDELE